MTALEKYVDNVALMDEAQGPARKRSKKHWIAGSGTHGCLFDHCEVYPTKAGAIADLAQLFDDVRGVASDLRKYNYCELADKRTYDGQPGNSGADYCEVSSCDCDDPACHSDSNSWED